MKADIFFFITTIAVVFLSILLGVALYYIITTFRRLRTLCEKVEQNIDIANIHVKEITTKIKESFLFNLIFGKKGNSKKRL